VQNRGRGCVSRLPPWIRLSNIINLTSPPTRSTLHKSYLQPSKGLYKG
jgi:hypothetical protein